MLKSYFITGTDTDVGKTYVTAGIAAAMQNLGLEIDIKIVLNSFKKLSTMHDVLLVEGIGGIMTPILKNYFVTNLIKEMDLETIIVASSRIGTVNHIIMTIKMCQNYGIKVGGIIINNVNSSIIL